MSAISLPQKLSLFLSIARIELVGLAQDFWKDPKPGTPQTAPKPVPSSVAETVPAAAVATPLATRKASGRWHAEKYQLLEKIWGDGEVIPGNETLEKALIAPLGLNKEKSVLDLSAGLGGLARRLAKEFGCYVTGMEQDETFIAPGTDMSHRAGKSKQATLEAYDPAKFSPSRRYDGVVVREMFFKIISKDKFFPAVAMALKSGGMLTFTDYVLDPADGGKPAVKAWLSQEADAAPYSSDIMMQTFSKLKIDMRVNEDQTAAYVREILKRLKLFAEFLARHHPDEETANLVAAETEKWALRVAAFQEGLKFYRFEGIKK